MWGDEGVLTRRQGIAGGRDRRDLHEARSGLPPSYRYVGATPRTLPGGWESIGDIGWFDEDGYLYLADRRTDMILVGGANVYPAEIEAALDEHPLVASSAVIGLPDDELGNRVHAIVQPRDGLDLERSAKAPGRAAGDLQAAAHVRARRGERPRRRRQGAAHGAARRADQEGEELGSLSFNCPQKMRCHPRRAKRGKGDPGCAVGKVSKTYCDKLFCNSRDTACPGSPSLTPLRCTSRG